MPSANSTSCGFDFGTSNSSIGQYKGNAPALVPIQSGRVSIPTAIFFSFDDGNAYHGREAIDRYLNRDEGRLMRALKGVLGSSLIHETTMVKRERLRFLDIIARFIAYVRDAAGGPSSVVMGRPVHFVDDNETADRDAEDQLRSAAKLAGFTNVEFQFEPIAAALDYEHTVTSEQLAFVVDIGGGTSDFSIVRVSPNRRGKVDRKSDILGYSGIRIGGTDFDKYLELRAVMPLLGLGSKLRHKDMEPPVWWYHDLATWQRINVMYDPRVSTEIRRVRHEAMEPEKLERLLRIIETRKGHALLGAVEQAKIALSDEEKTSLRLHDLAGLKDTQITRRQLDAAIGASVDRVAERLKLTLQKASVKATEIDAVFLTGGSSKLPLLRAKVRAIFPEASIIEGDAFGSVATGLTIDAYNRFGR
ncbi:MAG: Hsp70 family protein [Hyphomicrobiaceae bacterium]|nr:Hsp70 family protein [Hyphomicrobiaceae bacterium]